MSIKIKGLSHDSVSKDVTFDLLKSLLHKDRSLTFNQTKYFRNLGLSTINLLEQTYNLIPTDNKRQLVYDNNNMLISTKPYVINQDKTIEWCYNFRSRILNLRKYIANINILYPAERIKMFISFINWELNKEN